MITNPATVSVPEQPNLSDQVRVIVKRTASESGGLVRFMRGLGINYSRAWEQMNRSQGVRVDLLPALSASGIDEPLRMVADACGYDVTPKPNFLRKKNTQPRPVRSHALAIHHAAAAVTMKVEEALGDQRIDEREREAIKSALHKLRVGIAELELRIRVRSDSGPDHDIASVPRRLRSKALATRLGTSVRAGE